MAEPRFAGWRCSASVFAASRSRSSSRWRTWTLEHKIPLFPKWSELLHQSEAVISHHQPIIQRPPAQWPASTSETTTKASDGITGSSPKASNGRTWGNIVDWWTKQPQRMHYAAAGGSPEEARRERWRLAVLPRNGHSGLRMHAQFA